MPVERERRQGIPTAHQAVLEVRVGPSPDERAQGFLDTIDSQTRLRSVAISSGTATVELAGREPDLYASGAIVHSLTALQGIERVSLRLGGRPCCVYRHDGKPIMFVSRRHYAGWQGEPCGERDRPDAVRCRG
jgi:hypothetical protein